LRRRVSALPDMVMKEKVLRNHKMAHEIAPRSVKSWGDFVIGFTSD